MFCLVVKDEKYGFRCEEYSRWHRETGEEDIPCIDLDYTLFVEYADGSKEIKALMEVARDVGQPYKSATITRQLCERSGIPGYCLLYSVGDHGIESFRVRKIYPVNECLWTDYTLDEWLNELKGLRANGFVL